MADIAFPCEARHIKKILSYIKPNEFFFVTTYGNIVVEEPYIYLKLFCQGHFGKMFND